MNEAVQTQDIVIGNQTYRHIPNGTQYNYVGPDGERYRKHENGGGLVGEYAVVWDIVHVGPQCRVFGGAELRGAGNVTGRAQVGGTVKSFGHVTFAKDAYVTVGEFFGEQIITEPKKV